MAITRRALTGALLGAAAGLTPLAALAREWTSAHFAANPLVGKVFDRTGAETSLEAVKARAVAARYVMLGEIHPNPDHHALQAEMLAHMIAAGRKPAVVFEMVTRAQQPVLDAAMANPETGTAALGEQLQWASSGWPDFKLYEPLFRLGLENDLRLLAGNLDRPTIRRMGGRDGQPLSEVERAGLGLAEPFPEAANLAMLDVIRSSHCNMLPDTILPMMRDIQRARDFVMADAMMNAANRDGAVLICGAGHARLDWGAGLLVDRAAPEELASIAFSEVFESMTAKDLDLSGHHFTMMTPRADVTDHCAAFAKPSGSQ